MTTTWEKVGKVAPGDLSPARRELHWAAQLPGAVGNAMVAHRDDDSQEALDCIAERSLLVGRATDTPTPLRVALSLPDLRVAVLDQELGELASLTLQGKTLEEGFTWLASELGQRGGLDNPPALAVPEYDMPDHELWMAFFHDSEGNQLAPCRSRRCGAPAPRVLLQGPGLCSRGSSRGGLPRYPRALPASDGRHLARRTPFWAPRRETTCPECPDRTRWRGPDLWRA